MKRATTEIPNAASPNDAALANMASPKHAMQLHITNIKVSEKRFLTISPMKRPTDMKDA